MAGKFRRQALKLLRPRPRPPPKPVASPRIPAITPAASRPCRIAPMSRGPPRLSARRDSDARHVGRAPQRIARYCPRAPARQEIRQPNRGARAISSGSSQRRHQPFGKKPRPAPRHRPVDRLQQAAVAAARQRAQQFQIGSRRRVDEQGRSAGLPLRSCQWRAFRQLGLFDIGDRSGGGRKFGAAKNCRSRPAWRHRKTASIRPSALPLSNRHGRAAG